jgi:uncharacterized protein (DUF427 family)
VVDPIRDRVLEDEDLDVLDRAYEEGGSLRVQPAGRRVRVFLGGVAVADSDRVLLQLERRRLPVYYFPVEDVRMDLAARTDKTTRSPLKGEASFWTIRVGDREAPNAMWAYEDPALEAKELAGHVAFYWHLMDAWFEEDDEVYVHPRDPYKRVDVLQSSRHVRVVVDGETVAETRRPRLLLETGLPTRYYIPKVDVRLDVLRPSDTHTRCPYKGQASYWDVVVGDTVRPNLAWAYPEPIPECPKIENHLAFFNEHADIYVDGKLQERPTDTPWA